MSPSLDFTSTAINFLTSSFLLNLRVSALFAALCSLIHCYAYDSTLHFSTSFIRQPTLQELSNSRRDATERLTSDLSTYNI